MAEDYIRSAVWAMIIGVVKEPAQIGLDAQRVEVVGTRLQTPDHRGAFAFIQSYLSDSITHQTIKAVVPVAQVNIVGIGLNRGVIAGTLDQIETLRLGHVQ